MAAAAMGGHRSRSRRTPRHHLVVRSVWRREFASMSAPCPILGFVLSLTFDRDVSEADREAMLDDLMALLDRHGLAADGRRSRAMALSIRRDGSQATDA